MLFSCPLRLIFGTIALYFPCLLPFSLHTKTLLGFLFLTRFIFISKHLTSRQPAHFPPRLVVFSLQIRHFKDSVFYIYGQDRSVSWKWSETNGLYNLFNRTLGEHIQEVYFFEIGSYECKNIFLLMPVQKIVIYK